MRYLLLLVLFFSWSAHANVLYTPSSANKYMVADTPGPEYPPGPYYPPGPFYPPGPMPVPSGLLTEKHHTPFARGTVEVVVHRAVRHLSRQDRQIECLALNIYHEAAFEPLMGQIGVAAVTLNRSHERHRSVCKTVWAPKQFSWTTGALDGEGRLRASLQPRNNKVWKRIRLLAAALIKCKYVDPTHGANHYHADYVHPRWAANLDFTVMIGHHLFYRTTT